LLAQLKLSQPEYVHFKARMALKSAGYLYKPIELRPGKDYRPFFARTAVQFGRITQNSPILPSCSRPTLPVLLPIRAVPLVTVRISAKQSGGLGEQGLSGRHAMVDYAIEKGIAIPRARGRRLVYGGISTDFIIGQTTRFKAAFPVAGAADSPAFTATTNTSETISHRIGYPWETKLSGRGSRHSIRSKYHHARLFMGGNVDWNVPSSWRAEMYKRSKLWARDGTSRFPGEYQRILDAVAYCGPACRYLAWYNHYLKSDQRRPACRRTLRSSTNGQSMRTGSWCSVDCASGRKAHWPSRA